MWRITDDLTFAFDPAGANFQPVEERVTYGDRLIPLDAIALAAIALAGLGVLLAARGPDGPGGYFSSITHTPLQSGGGGVSVRIRQRSR
jgi:hypothetical protein